MIQKAGLVVRETHLPNESADLGQDSSDGQVDLPLVAVLPAVLRQFPQQLQELLGVLPGLCHLVQEGAEKVENLSLSGLPASQAGQDVGRGSSGRLGGTVEEHGAEPRHLLQCGGNLGHWGE